MSKQIEALKLALEALEIVKIHFTKNRHVNEAITAICEALAEQPAQQRPQNCGTGFCSCIECPYEQPAQQQGWKLVPVQPTDEMRDAGNAIIGDRGALFAAYRAMLNAAPQPAQQEPVAWRTKNATPPGGYVVFQQYPQAVADLGVEIEPLYTSPQPSKPLTDAQIGAVAADIWGSILIAPQSYQAFARAIEAAHGITGETNDLLQPQLQPRA